MHRLAHPWTHPALSTPSVVIVIRTVIKHLSDTHSHILLQQDPPPPPVLPDAPLPPPDLALVVGAPPPHKEAAVPLKPPAHVVRMVDPPGSLPLLDALPAGRLELIQLRLIVRAREIGGDVETREPLWRQLAPVVTDGGAQVGRVQGAEVRAAEGAFAQDLLGGFVGAERGVRGEVEGGVVRGAGRGWGG